MGAAVAPLREDRKNNWVGRGAGGGEGAGEISAQQRGLPPPPPDAAAGRRVHALQDSISSRLEARMCSLPQEECSLRQNC